MEKLVLVQCGRKRNFDVAFLSGENDIDKDGKKKEKEKEETEQERERQTQKEHSPLVGNSSAFTRYCKRGQENNNVEDGRMTSLHSRLIHGDAEPMIGNNVPRADDSDSNNFTAQTNFSQFFGTTTSTITSQNLNPFVQFSPLKKLLDATAFQNKNELSPLSRKMQIFPNLLGGPNLIHPALIAHPPPAAISALGPSASNTCAKCGITFRMTSDLVYHMRTHHTRGADNWRETSSFEKRRQGDRLKCNVCGENFRERHHLTRHMTAHQDKAEESLKDETNKCEKKPEVFKSEILGVPSTFLSREATGRQLGFTVSGIWPPDGAKMNSMEGL